MNDYIKITNGNSVVLTLDDAKEFLEETIGETGSEYVFEMVQMPASDFAALPEFEGF